ncbi:hypothetical protein [Streptomyces sp. NRRL B-24484]|uniref:hypothetical protein n=1 Tax=Streptomyces sp. NRRL B-24484 TaxID=1463833 RepID=UPI0004C0C8EB|nr:hypothetical protein [Streptomyces sp. NRRL B-24484]
MHRRFRRRGLAVLPVAVLLAAVPGCRADDGAAPSAAASSAPAPVAPGIGGSIAAPGRLVVAWCDRWGVASPTAADAKADLVTVQAVGAADGRVADERAAVLPDGATAPGLCRPQRYTAAAADRQLFNADFTLLAGTVPGPGGSGRAAAAFAVLDGRTTSAEPGTVPDGRGAFFGAGGSALWYATADGRAASHDLAAGAARPADRGAVPGPDFALDGDRLWPARPLETKADEVVVAPGGAVAAGFADGGAVLWRRDAPASPYGARYVEPVRIGGGDRGAALPGSEQVPWCTPRLWLDGRTLLCATEDNLQQVVLSADFTAVERAEQLLPAGGSRPTGAVLSPDGRSLAYLGGRYEETVLYRLDLAPGARPVAVAALPTRAPVRPETGRTVLPGTDRGAPVLVAWL